MRFQIAAKAFTVIFVAAFSINSFGGNGVERYVTIDFSAVGKMSDRAQEKVEKVINSRCQPAASIASTLSANLVDVTSKEVDQGVVDVTYTVDVNFYSEETNQEAVATIKLTDYAGSNPSIDWVEVEGFSTSINGLCL